MLGFFALVMLLMSIVAVACFFVANKLLQSYRWRWKIYGVLSFLNLGAIFGMCLAASGIVFPETSFCLECMVVFFMGQLFFAVGGSIYLLFTFFMEKLISQPVDEKRRLVAKKVLLLPVGALCLSAYGSFFERKHTVIRSFAIEMKNLPGAFDGLRLAQLSDVHLGLFFSLEDFSELLSRTAALGVDMLILTGDIFDSNDINEKAIKLLDSFSDRFSKGIWFCYGNHEHMRNMEVIRQGLADSAIHVLCNDSAAIKVGDSSLYMIGVDYPQPRAAFDDLSAKYLEQATAEVPAGAAAIFLAHHPDFFDGASAKGIPLTLSGHTHGGQLGLFGVPLVPPLFKYMRGMFAQKHCHLYVHSGNGSWFPYRFGCPPEIAIFTLC